MMFSRYNLLLKMLAIAAIIALFVLIFQPLAYIAHSENDESPPDKIPGIDANADGDASIAKCIAKGNIDIILFLDSALGGDSFGDAFFETWKDVLWRNQCHGQDVLGLIRQRDKIEEAIRDAFFTCNTRKLPQMKKAYHKLKAEIYYVRYVVDGYIVLSLPYDLLTTRMAENPDELYTPRSEIYQNMYKRYVNGDFPREEFDKFFVNLEKKYEDRKKTYIICETGSWDTVAEKWEEFIETAGGAGPGAKNFEKAVNQRAEKVIESASDMSFMGFLKGLYQVNINNLEPEQAFDEFVENMEEDYGSIGDFATPTTEDVLRGLAYEDYRYETDELEAMMRSEYESLYREGTDVTIELFVNELESLNSIIEASFGPMKTVFDCAKTMNKRQCPGG